MLTTGDILMEMLNKGKLLTDNTTLKDFDIVLASKALLARNLADHRFPGYIQKQEQAKLTHTLIQALTGLPGNMQFEVYNVDDLEPVRLKQLQEKNVLDAEYYYYADNPVIINNKQFVTAKIGEEEHLRLSSVYPGLALYQVYQKVDGIDSLLDGVLNYACSLEWGYHCSSLKNFGTGLKITVFLHLPALVFSTDMEKIIHSLSERGVFINGLYNEEKEYTGSVFQVTNQFSFGMNEREIIENLINAIAPVINQERKTRQELYNRNKYELEDRIFRAYGTLKYARLLTFKEAIENLSLLRMGICQGLIDNPGLEEITDLFFLLKDIHIKKLIKKFDSIEKDDKFINKVRAKMIRDVL